MTRTATKTHRKRSTSQRHLQGLHYRSGYRPARKARNMRVLRIRRQIADGCYETEQKLDAAADRLIEKLFARRM